MKIVAAGLLIAVALLITFGSPFPRQQPERARYYDSPEPILPMSFAHQDHATVNCLECHHNFADGTGSGMCMNCHVTNAELWPSLESQFHGLCRDCHAREAARGHDHKPPRQCVVCHLGDDLP